MRGNGGIQGQNIPVQPAPAQPIPGQAVPQALAQSILGQPAPDALASDSSNVEIILDQAISAQPSPFQPAQPNPSEGVQAQQSEQSHLQSVGLQPESAQSLQAFTIPTYVQAKKRF